MIYDIINPSDPVTVESDDYVVAAVAILLLSQGYYGLMDEQGKLVLPIFRFSPRDHFEAWLEEVGISDMKSYAAKHKEAVAEVLESAVVGSIPERAGIVESCRANGADVKEALAYYNEKNRTSLTDICGVAHALAAKIREGEPGPSVSVLTF